MEMKNKHSKQITPTINNEYYYGEMKMLSNDNDVSFLHRGGVYYLKDYTCSNKHEKTYHPYIIIQYKYYDKTGDVAAFGITSTPSSIDMIPVIIDSGITYIDPHKIYTFKIDSLKRGTDVRYIGDMVNTKAFNLALDFYGLFIGMNIIKSEKEIYDEYFQYVNDFFERNQKYKPVKHKADKGVDRQLTIRFTTSRDVHTIIDKLDNDELSTCKSTDKDKLVIELKNQAVLSAIGELESQPKGFVIFPSTVTQMTKDEIVIFLTYKKLNTVLKTAEFYNCSHGTISKRYSQLQTKYDISYI